MNVADLPVGTVVIDEDGMAYQQQSDGWFVADNWECVINPAEINARHPKEVWRP